MSRFAEKIHMIHVVIFRRSSICGLYAQRNKTTMYGKNDTNNLAYKEQNIRSIKRITVKTSSRQSYASETNEAHTNTHDRGYTNHIES